ncbi:transporter substrate-binding domain-containing protein [Marinobacteraceae bacterium S3BR75-40.1]
MRTVMLALLLQLATPCLADAFTFATFEFAPLEFQTDQGQPEGVAVELVTEVMERLGHRIEIRVLPWAMALELVKDGKVDAIFTAYENEERRQFLDYSREVLVPQQVHFYTRPDYPATFQGDLALFEGRRVGVVSTISYGQVFDQYRARYQIERVRTLESNIKKLLLKRIDVFPSNRYVAERTLTRLGLADQVRRHDRAIEAVPSYIAFSKKKHLKWLRDDFDQAFLNFSQTPSYREIFARYGMNPPAPEAVADLQP